MFHSFEDLEVWKLACQLAVQVYQALHDSKEFGLRDQMQRSAVSIASNVAEGAERGGRDFQRFLRVARGSAAELRTQCYIAARVGVLTSDQASAIVKDVKRVSKMLTGLSQSLENQADDV